MQPLVWRSAISVLTLDKIKLNDNPYGELLLAVTLEKKLNDDQYGELLLEL